MESTLPFEIPVCIQAQTAQIIRSFGSKISQNKVVLLETLTLKRSDLVSQM